MMKIQEWVSRRLLSCPGMYLTSVLCSEMNCSRSACRNWWVGVHGESASFQRVVKVCLSESRTLCASVMEGFCASVS